MFTKTKRQRLPSIFSQSFEFVSPLPPEECAARLKDKSEPWRLFRFKNPLRVNVARTDQGVYEFKLQRDAGRNLNVEVVGTLQQLEDDSTLVSGVGRISRSTFILLLVIVAIQIPLFGAAIGIGAYSLLLVPLLLIFWVSCFAERQRLVDLLMNTLGMLGALKKKRIPTKGDDDA